MTDPVTYLLGRRAWGRLFLACMWCFWLGGGLGLVTGYGWGTWQWWVFVIPLVLLVNLYCYIITMACLEQSIQIRRPGRAIAN